MDNIQKALLAIAAVLFVVAVAITITPPPPVETNQTAADEGKAIINFSVNFGKNASDYTYAFSETYNGYLETYKLVSNGGRKYAEVNDLISVKKTYFLENDTILCIDYQTKSMCSSLKNVSDGLGYKSYILGKFFSDAEITQEEAFVAKLLDGGYLAIASVTDANVDGHSCRMVNYVIDYSNMTAVDAARIGLTLTPDLPQHFEWKICADNRMVYYRYFNYTYGGRLNEYGLLVKEYGPASEIAAPENLTEGAYDALLEENDHRNGLIDCFDQTGEEKDRCVAMVALNLMNTQLCEYAGERRDRCLVSIVPFKLDESICRQTTNQSFKDDCYTEMAGGTKNSSYCAHIADMAKAEFCMNITRNETTGIPNPAAVNCADKGYGYEIRSNESGEYGVCTYNGKECDEWALFRSECCFMDADCLGGGLCASNLCAYSGNQTNSTG